MKTEKIRDSKSTWKVKAVWGIAALGFLLGCASLASAAHVYDEAIDGDLPHPNKAFVIPFGAPNPNTIKFTMDLASDGWIIDIGPGESLLSFTLTDFAPVGAAATATFHIYDGPLVTDPVLGTAFASFDLGMLNVDFLNYYGIGPLGPGQYLFNFWHDNSPIYPTMEFDLNFEESLESDSDELPETGGVINFSLNAGPANANRDYIILGSITGTSPGLPLPGGMVTLPLVWDQFSELTIVYGNTPFMSNFRSSLDANGQAAAQLNSYGPLPPGMLGVTLYFAYTLYSPPWNHCDFVSNSIAVLIVP